MTPIDITYLHGVTGAIREGGCIVRDPLTEQIMERLRNAKFPQLPALPERRKAPTTK